MDRAERVRNKRLRILLTGGSGLLGRELLEADSSIIAPGSADLDVTKPESVDAAFAQYRPDIVIHAAAVTDNRYAERNPAHAVRVNVSGTANVALSCLSSGVRLVYLSTDYVYPGFAGNYSEEDAISPSNLYAWTKLGGEASVRTVPNHLIIRTSFGAAEFPYTHAFADKWSSKEYVDVLAPEILEVARGPLTGILNMGGPRRTLYDYAISRNPDVQSMVMEEGQHLTPADSSLDLAKWLDYKSGNSVVKPVSCCRICGNDELLKYLDLGMMPLANNLAESASAARQMQRIPMQVLFCTECSLSQLSVVVDPEVLFSHYTYRSSVNKGYVRHCREMARSIGSDLQLDKSSLVIDVAGNDGTLLEQFREELGVSVINVDPAENIVRISEQRGVPAVNAFWSPAVAKSIVEDTGKADLITATNVFAHVDDVRSFFVAAEICLQSSGVLMLEFPYCVDFIEQREFDTIYFEHLSYVLLAPVVRLASETGLEVFDVQKQEIHGGTVRVLIGKQGERPVRESVEQFVSSEREGGYHDADRYMRWAAEVSGVIERLKTEIGTLQGKGASIAAFAASAKGNTLLNACGLDDSTINFIVDDTPEKIGRFSPGTGIAIVNRERLAEAPPDYLIILAWNFAEEIIDNTAGFTGKFIVPIPEFRIL